MMTKNRREPMVFRPAELYRIEHILRRMTEEELKKLKKDIESIHNGNKKENTYLHDRGLLVE